MNAGFAIITSQTGTFAIQKKQNATGGVWLRETNWKEGRKEGRKERKKERKKEKGKKERKKGIVNKRIIKFNYHNRVNPIHKLEIKEVA